MRMFEIHPLTAAVLFTILIMGLIGLFVIIPVACIQWVWNGTLAHLSFLPQIDPWQAGLLYLATATLLYLTGIVRIDIQAGGAE